MFTGNENQDINLTTASALTKAYRDANSGQILGHYLSKKIIGEILSQPNCVGIRVYYAINPTTSEKELVVSGVLENGDDIVNGVLGDRTFKSPPFTGATNALNS